jgi:ornithine decarboxylase
MNSVQRFTFLFSAPTFEAEDLEGLRVAEIIAAIQRMGFQVIRAPRIEDAEIAVQTDAAIAAALSSTGARRDWKARPPR